MQVDYLRHVLPHTLAEVSLLMLTTLGLQLVQRFALTPLSLVVEESFGSSALLQPVVDFRPSLFLDKQSEKYWSNTSFVLWVLFGYGAQFLLHLPSLWKKRIQLTKAFRPLGEDWYSQLKRPAWFPKGYFFPLVWIPVKFVRAIGHSLLWESLEHNSMSMPVMLGVMTYVFGNMWNQVVFVQHDLLGGITVLGMQIFCMISIVVYCLFEVPSIAKFFIPYTVSACAALILNVALLAKNYEQRSSRPMES
ncbi:hypothetical protein NDN08_005126 [Rhodosorus marinus]|uniref:Uncharacterized protein n=1 Tax=Rhodosorus marinus TaxID=101924 RepID=A0AAV8V3R5_9RHOD|nr:hypothetical protein NDN08_005126 [Rhodosorus marinus]